MNTDLKNKVLMHLAQLIEKNTNLILEINQKDISLFKKNDEAMLDRLKINEEKISAMISVIKNVAQLKDYENEVTYSFKNPNGMLVENKKVPIGKILIIYESRPDVTIEASILAFKSGNRVLLKGGKEAKNTNLFLVDLWQTALKKFNVDENFIQYLDLERLETLDLIKNNTEKIDLIIPRGGESLINFVQQNTSIPILISGRGNNFIFVDSDSDFDMALKIILNGKQRISVCNALDKVLIDKNLNNIDAKITQLKNKLTKNNIEIIENNFDENIMNQEFLSKKILINKVSGVDKAINLINQYSGGHSAGIITNNKIIAEKFQNQVDCAAVHHNTSIRLTDGSEFGLGSEIAISTQKLHTRGAIGLESLLTNKWFIYGNGQVR